MCAFDVSAIMCVVSPGAIFIESAIIFVLSAAVLLFWAFLHAPAAMTTTATANAMRFMLAPVEVRGLVTTAKRT
jgi:hypothetical protein